MEAGLESVSLLAMTFLRHLLNVSLVVMFSAFISDGTRRQTRKLDISKRFQLLQAILDSIRRRSVASYTHGISPHFWRLRSRGRLTNHHSHLFAPLSKGITPGFLPQREYRSPNHLPLALQVMSYPAIMHQTCLKLSAFQSTNDSLKARVAAETTTRARFPYAPFHTAPRMEFIPIAPLTPRGIT
jgi:hypothetical protein